MEGKISEETLQVRLYAVDCPEIAHFGNPLQPFGEEAKQVGKASPVAAPRLPLVLRQNTSVLFAFCGPVSAKELRSEASSRISADVGGQSSPRTVGATSSLP